MGNQFCHCSDPNAHAPSGHSNNGPSVGWSLMPLTHRALHRFCGTVLGLVPSYLPISARHHGHSVKTSGFPDVAVQPESAHFGSCLCNLVWRRTAADPKAERKPRAWYSGNIVLFWIATQVFHCADETGGSSGTAALSASAGVAHETYSYRLDLASCFRVPPRVSGGTYKTPLLRDRLRSCRRRLGTR